MQWYTWGMKYVDADSGEWQHKKDYSKKFILDQDAFGNDGHLLQVVTIPPQTKQRVHWHHQQTEVFYILEGEAIIYINDQEYPSKPGDAFICSPGDKHNLWNQSDEPFSLLVFKIDLPQDDDTEWVEE